MCQKSIINSAAREEHNNIIILQLPIPGRQETKQILIRNLLIDDFN